MWDRSYIAWDAKPGSEHSIGLACSVVAELGLILPFNFSRVGLMNAEYELSQALNYCDVLSLSGGRCDVKFSR